jgi:hypothetical protein
MNYGEHGQLLNPNLSDYNVPSFADVPLTIDASALEHVGSEELHGIGETLLPPVMAAIGMPYITLPECAFRSSRSLRRKFCGKSTSSIQQMTFLPVCERTKVRTSRSDADQGKHAHLIPLQLEMSLKGTA